MSDPRGSAVLFDIDGTLVDSTYHHALAWHRAFAVLGDPPPMWRLHRAIGMGGDKLVGEVAGDDTEDEHGDELRDRWREEYLKIRAEVVALPGAADLVRKLSQDGFRVALASSGDPQFAREAVDLLGIADLVETLTSSEDVEASKPEPDLVGVTLDRLGDVERAVFVGDTPYDVAAANRAGLGCLSVLTGGFSRSELSQAGAVVVAESLSELLADDWTEHVRD
ncbi:HAD family hydrolase [Nocardioides sp. URHA0020]|uniref:HAD family hydrolase n=1 Tax=Nocardioides sp. URHA0020 TaxID=1380392 RepID=UPI000490760D|nr:HAD family hydrolase [Nocardioides sp. URHA0020]